MINKMAECMFCKCFSESVIRENEKVDRDEDENSEVACLQNDQNPLKNWENWMRRRMDINKKLSEKLNRPFGELLMNAAEEYRNVKEEKIMFENMKINTNFDKYRGNPAFWHLPPSLEEHCRTKCRKKCPCDDPVYFAIKTHFQKNEIPKIEYIGISNHILEEKNVLPRTRNIYALWQKNPYRKAFLNKVRSELNHLEPHRPQNSSLIVFGSQKIESTDRKLEESDSKIESSSSSNDVDSSDKVNSNIIRNTEPHISSSMTVDFHDIDVVNLIINGTRIIASHLQEDMKIRILFELGEVPTKPVTNYVKLENKGKATLRLHFTKYEKFFTFKDIVSRIGKPSPFYFDKREILLLPGKTIDFPIWFKPPSTGHFYETWKITAFPRIWNESSNLLFLIQGVVYKEDFNLISQTIRDMLTLRARNTLIKDALREILNSTKYESRDVVKYTYTEKNYFEAANQEYWGTVKRPKYVYDKKVVRQLQNFYKQIRCPEDEVFWNYSVEHLRRIARKRDVMDFIEKLYKKCEKGQRRARYLHDMYSASNVGVEDIQKNEQLESSSSPYSSIGNQMLINKSQSQVVPKLETNYETLNKLLEKLERSVMIKNTDREKFATAYFILRYYFLKIADELSGDSASFLSLLNLKAPTKIEETPERMLFEKFDPIWVERKRRLPPIDVGGLPLSKPKPKVLEGVPLDKPQLVYDRYFKKSAPAKGKKEKTEKENIQKDKKKKNKDAVTKSLVNVVNGNFDPFADFVVPVNSQTMEKDKSSVSQATVSSGSIKIPQSTTLSYYDKYLIVYTNLAAAVDSMVSALETMKDNTIDTQILSELTNCNIVNLITDYNRCSVSTEKSEEDKDTNLREPDEYFEYLMKTHLTDNINIQDYFINGETLPIVADITEETDTIIKPIESFHLFQLTDGQSDTSADVKSGEMQTSINYDDDFKPFSNILIEDELLSERVQSEQEANQSEHEEEEVSSEIFYYIENGL